jgi:hypothetical protein
MKYLVVVVALLCAPRSSFAQSSSQHSVEIEWTGAGSGTPGYEFAAISINYQFLVCSGSVVMHYRVVPSSFRVTEWYWWNGKRHLVPDVAPPKISTIDFAGSFTSNGSTVRTFRDGAAGSYGGAGCLGQTQTVGSVRELVGEKPTPDEIQMYVDSLAIVVRRIGYTVRNASLEGSLSQKEKEREKAERDRIAKEKADKDAADKAERDRIEKEKDDANKAGSDGATDPTTDKPGETGNQPADGRKPTDANKTFDATTQTPPERSNEELGQKTAWRPGDEEDAGYWPEERCSFWDKDGFISPPLGRHRCDPKFIEWVFQERGKQMQRRYAPQLTPQQHLQQNPTYQKLGLAGAAIGGIVGASSSSGSSSEYDEFEGGPGLAAPVLVFLEGGLFGALTYMGVSLGIGPNLSRRIDALSKTKLVLHEYRCSRGSSGSCDSLDSWKRAVDPMQRRKLSWDAESLLGPGSSFGFGIGYVRERRGGFADPSSPAMFDGVLSGLALDAAWRMRFVRAEVGFHHLRGDLLANRGDDLRYTTSQGLNAFTAGLALQLGWHQLISPYVGYRYRVDFQSGDFADEFDGENNILHGRIRSLGGGRRLLALGATLQLPAQFSDAMFRSWALNVELYRSLDDSAISDGVAVTFGRNAWAPSWLTGLDGLSTASGAEDHDTWFLPYVSQRGIGMKVVTYDRKRVSFTLGDAWLDPSADGNHFGTSGVTVLQVGPRLKLPVFDHSLSITAGVGVNSWVGDEVITIQPGPMDFPQEPRNERVRTFGIGTVSAAYRVFIRNHAVEAGVKMPLLWWENRLTNKLAFDDPTYFVGWPKFAYVGFGY